MIVSNGKNGSSKLLRLRIFLSVAFIFLSFCCYSQGSWNIGYLEARSIDKKHVGNTVRIDFKSPSTNVDAHKKRSVRSYVGTTDTGFLVIESKRFDFAERRTIHVDSGIYADQFLECINCANQPMLIRDAKILEVDKQFILFEFDIEMKSNQSSKREKKIIRVERSKLDGVMFKE